MNRLLGYLVTFLLLFGLLDGVLRLAGCSPQPVRVEFDDTRGWRNKQSADTESEGKEFDVSVHFNSLGMRGDEVAEAKPADTKRILFVGDSFTLGYTVEERDLFLHILEQELQANGHKVQVLNGGTEGYSTDQELLWFEQKGANLKPDYVVLAPYLNDVYWNSQAKYMVREKAQYQVEGDGVRRVSTTLQNSGDKSWFTTHTAVGTFLDRMKSGKVFQQHVVAHNGRKVFLEDAPLLASPPVEIDRAWKLTDALVKEFAAKVKAAGATPLALVVPNRWEIQTGEAPPRTLGGVSEAELAPSSPTDHFKRACTDAGFDVIDPRGSLKAAFAGGPVYFKHDWHWNERGNRVVAAELLSHFEKPRYLGEGNGSVRPEALISKLSDDEAKAGVPTWMIVVGVLWLLLGFGYVRSYPKENPVFAFLKVGALISFVAGVFIGVGKLADSLPPSIGKWVVPLIAIGLIGFIVVKAGRRMGIISELYGTFLRRGHWYMLPMLVVMLSIGMLLVVAASSPFVAPFIYTLF